MESNVTSWNLTSQKSHHLEDTKDNDRNAIENSKVGWFLDYLDPDNDPRIVGQEGIKLGS